MARIFDKVLADPRVRFFGNVTYGIDLRRQELKRLYHQIVYAVGAQADRRMSIPGEDLPNSFPASSFVGWYNGHPDYRDLPADLSCERAVVIGNGNVAMDVTRILVTSPDALAGTDIADHALEKLRHSKIREVVVLGRRGPVQASFTTPEIRELGKLDGMDVIVDPRNLRLEAASKSELDEDRTAKANLRILDDYAARADHSAPRRIILRFLASPVEIIGAYGRITALKIERNELVMDPNGRCGRGDSASSRSSRPVWCCARSAIAPCRSKACLRSGDLDDQQHRRAGRPSEYRRGGAWRICRRMGKARPDGADRQQQGRRGRHRQCHGG